MNTANKLPVLDHGFVILRNMAGPTRRAMNPAIESDSKATLFQFESDTGELFLERQFDADDTDIANSARMSFDASDQDRSYEVEMKLARYLMTNHHSTPFESVEVWLEMKLPIFIARQFIRHRTAGVNEVSGRYVTLPAEWYIPEIVGAKPINKKQGQATGMDPILQEQFKEALRRHCQRGYVAYTNAIEDGVAPEHARMFLSLNHYTHWLWKQDLRNMMHFLGLRAHAHAQIEAQKYAEAIIALLTPHIPGIMALWQELRK